MPEAPTLRVRRVVLAYIVREAPTLNQRSVVIFCFCNSNERHHHLLAYAFGAYVVAPESICQKQLAPESICQKQLPRSDAGCGRIV